MNYISINEIMDGITKHPLLKEIPLETVISYAIEFIRIVGMPPEFIDKTAEIDIVDYKGQLPCDFYEMVQVRLATPEGTTFRYSTDSFHMSSHKLSPSDLTYKLQGNCIFTFPLEKGVIEIAYRAIPVDQNGHPMIPDNSSFEKALRAYIKKEWFDIQFSLGKISASVMAKADQDYAWVVGQAQTDLIRPDIDKMQSISNMWNTLLPRDDHRHGFITEGTQEHIKIH